jgi:N-acyl-D-amino-acid deacylase
MTSRRTFLRQSAAAVVAAPYVARSANVDLVLRNGQLLDGTASPGITGDVAVVNGRITAMGPSLPDRGRQEIDVRGLVVSPGFIDIHSHGDGSVFADARLESVVRQGITTIVVGQDGSSRATGVAAASEDAGATRFTRLADFFDAIDRVRPGANVASMIGLGSVRGAVVGLADRAATSAEVAHMTALVEGALRDGACGASSGLEYTPGAFARTDELIAVCTPLSARRLPYSTHMRNEDDQLLDAIRESIAVARGARCPLQIAHLKTQGPRNWGRLDAVFAAIDGARSTGLDVAFDRYPYIAYQTGLTNLFPVWSRDGGVDVFFTRLDDATDAARIRTETLEKVELIGGWDNVMIASVSAAEDRGAEGKRLGAYANSQSLDPYALAVLMLRRNRANVGMVGFAMSESNLDRILSHPLGMVCSDGGAFATDGPTRRGSPHPRGAGSFPRVLGRYVRERKALTLPQAIHKMTAYPASRLGITDRGRLVVGQAADITVFNAETIADRATYDAPFHYPVGISLVVVNGEIALREGQRATRNNGRAVRAGR